MKTTLTTSQETEARESFREHCMAEYGRWPNFADLGDVKNWYQFRAGWARARCAAVMETNVKIET